MSRTARISILCVSVAVFCYVGLGHVLGGTQDDKAYKSLTVYGEVLQKIQADYVDDPNMHLVTAGALHGLLESLDPASSYLTPREYTEYKQKSASNTQGDTGLTLSKRYGYVIVISVLDHRFRWSAMPPRVALVGDAFVVLGLVIIFLVFRENTFSAQTVEVEAGHRVIATGPYALVRHPMYAGGLVFILGIPLALGSLWGLASIVFFTPVAAWRILDEENLLAKDLPGYAEYEKRVKYRLLPHIW